MELKFEPIRLALFAAVFSVLALIREPLHSALWILDMVNLAFHEAGHPIFGLLGNHFVMVCGGTIMQLLMPAAVIVHFNRNDQPLSAWVALSWLGENFLGIGQYMADARAQVLPLVGGGEHDWTYLFEVFGVLPHDVGIGHATQLLGCAIMAWAFTSLSFGLYQRNATNEA